MGRRRGFVGTVFKEMERAAARSAANARRQQRRTEAATHRALERELVRQERAEERALRRAEREEELRRQLALKDQARAEAEAQKEAQLRTWVLEHETHQAQDEDIDAIANVAPEVEQRDAFFKDLQEAQPFEPGSRFQPPMYAPPQGEIAEARNRRTAAADAEISAFRPSLRPFRIAQLATLGVALIGPALLLVPQLAGYIDLATMFLGGGAALLLVVSLLAHWLGTRQRTAHSRQVLDVLERQMKNDEAALELEAKARYDAELAKARQAHAVAEAERQAFVAAVLQGDTQAMARALEEVLPLDLPVPCEAEAQVLSAARVAVRLRLPEPSALPAETSRLLASGKVSYKQKPQGQIREQYRRMVAGLALRYASEVLFNLPTAEVVELEAAQNLLDTSTGTHSWRPVFRIIVTYPTLAPMTMDKLDPVAALTHFEHSWKLSRGGELQPIA